MDKRCRISDNQKGKEAASRGLRRSRPCFGTAEHSLQSANAMQINNPHPYYAHSAENLPEEYWQTLQRHAYNAGEMAAEFAFFFGAQEIARSIGQLHDLGKYTPEFAARLRGGIKKVDHATAGAKIARERWGLIGRCMVFPCMPFFVRYS